MFRWLRRGSFVAPTGPAPVAPARPATALPASAPIGLLRPPPSLARPGPALAPRPQAPSRPPAPARASSADPFGDIPVVGRATPAVPGRAIPPPPAPLHTLADVAARVRLQPGNPPGLRHADDKPPPATDASWVPLGTAVTVQGLQVPGPFYLGRFLPTDPGQGWAAAQCASYLIIPDAPAVPTRPGMGLPPLGSWPSYNLLLPEWRHDFLRWLSLGRPAGADVGYALLAFYGMERRLLVDAITPGEEAALLGAVAELRRGYGHHAAFEANCVGLLDLCAARSLLRDPAALGAWRPEPGSFGQPMSACLKLVLACRAVVRQPVPLDLAVCGFVARPEAMAGRMVQAMARAKVEFCSLLMARLHAASPAGVMLESRQHVGLRLPYGGAPQYLGQSLGMRLVCQPGLDFLPEPDNLNWGRLHRITEDALDDLAPYVRALGTARGQARGIETLALLPPELAYLDPGGTRSKLLAWLDGLPQPLARIEQAELSRHCLGQDHVSFKDKELKAAAEALEQVGYAMEPDPLYGKLPRHPVPIFVYAALDPKQPRPLPDAAMQAGLAAADLLAFCTKGGPQLDVLWAMEVGAMLGLTEDMARRVSLRCCWQHEQPPTPAALKRVLEPFTSGERVAMAGVLTGALLRQGWPEAEMLPVLERLHDRLGVDRAALYRAMHAASGQPAAAAVAETGVPTKRAGRTRQAATPPAGGTDLPQSAGRQADAPGAPPWLDPVRLARIQAETRAVSATLASIMADPEAERAIPAAAPAPVPNVAGASAEPAAAGLPGKHLAALDDTRFAGLEPQCARLAAAVLAQAEWSRAEYVALARSLGLKPDGAMETINEWAFERLDDALIEDGDPLLVNAHLLPGQPPEQGNPP